MRRLLLVVVVGCGSSKEPAPSTKPATEPAKDAAAPAKDARASAKEATIATATIDGATTEQVADEPVLGNLDGAHAFCNTPADGLCIEWPPGRHAEVKKYCKGTWSTTSGCPSAGVLGLCINTEVPEAGRHWLYSSRFASIEAAHEKGVCWDRATSSRRAPASRAADRRIDAGFRAAGGWPNSRGQPGAGPERGWRRGRM